jgi:hypothetical protein
MAEYMGHESKNAWNVALWIGNDEFLYRAAVEALKSTHTVRKATNVFFGLTGLRDDKTPDGFKFTARSVGLALMGLEIEQPKRRY